MTKPNEGKSYINYLKAIAPKPKPETKREEVIEIQPNMTVTISFQGQVPQKGRNKVISQNSHQVDPIVILISW